MQSSFLTTDGAYGHERSLTGYEPTGIETESRGLPRPGSTPDRPAIIGKEAAADPEVYRDGKPEI